MSDNPETDVIIVLKDYLVEVGKEVDSLNSRIDKMNNRIDDLHLTLMELQCQVGELVGFKPGSTAEKAHRNLVRLLELIRRSDELMAEHNQQ